MVLNMNTEEKKRIANEKRLKAVKEWKKNRTVQKIKSVNTRIIFDEDIKEKPKNKKPKLFELSDDEGGKYEEDFKARPQFDGTYGQELLEMSSQFSGRFKLDERFREEELEPRHSQNEEKEKNLKILQNILGYDVSSKPSDKHQSRKRQVRFDPEDENASKYVKNAETPLEKPKKKKKRNLEEKLETEIPISTERYVEVSSNLKDILSEPSTGFSLTQQFNHEPNDEVNFLKERTEIHPGPVKKDKKETGNRKRSYQEAIEGNRNSQQNTRHFVPRVKNDYFFFKDGDPRLKEGVEFFKRTKPVEEIREEWVNKREYVVNQFRQKRKSSLRTHAAKVKTLQKRNAIRRQNWKK